MAPSLYLLPNSISRFLGYRSEPPKPIGSILVWLWSFIGAVCGILVVEAVFQTPLLKSNGAPIVLGSLVINILRDWRLHYKLFQHLSPPTFESVRFVGGALAVGLASAVMGVTNTIHPPAGATALMAVTSNEVMHLGWFLVPLIVLGSVLMVAVACIVNNLQRKYPLHWWTAMEFKVTTNEGFRRGERGGGDGNRRRWERFDSNQQKRCFGPGMVVVRSGGEGAVRAAEE